MKPQLKYEICSLTVQGGVREPGPDLNHVLRTPGMHQHEALVGAGVGAVLLLDVEGPEALVLLRGESQLLQAHAGVDVVDGIESYSIRDVV